MVNLFNEVFFGVYFEGGYRFCCIHSLLNCFFKCAQQGEALYTPYVIFLCEMIDNIVGKLQLVTFHHNNITSLGQGNILHKHVILSMGKGRSRGWLPSMHHNSQDWGDLPRGGVCLQGGICLQEGGLHPGGIGQTTPHEIHGILRDTVNKQAVRILLECILLLCNVTSSA